MSTQKKKRFEWLWAALVVIVTVVIGLVLFLKPESHAHDEGTEKKGHAAEEKPTSEQAHSHAEGEEGHAEEKAPEGVVMSVRQAAEQGIQIAQVEQGQVSRAMPYPAKVVNNLDQQAHISSNYAGRVEQVHVALGQLVKKGQVLAVIYAPDLVEQQANLDIATQNLQLAQQDYMREKTLFDQGVSAQQDYLRAQNTFKRAQIEVQALRSKFNALGLRVHAQGRYAIQSPIDGVVAKKDLVIGEYVQLSDQFMTIDQTGRLWLEFVLPNTLNVARQQKIQFKSLQSEQRYQAVVKTVLPEADAVTGQLKVQAEILDQAVTLKPNVMVNVWLNSGNDIIAPRIAKSALQQVDGKTVVFVVEEQQGELKLSPQAVEVGTTSSDEKWVEVKSGLTVAQRYVTQGSFILKSEMEKSEAGHAH